MPFNTKLLAEICETPGAPGFEKPIRDVVLREVKNLADEVTIDNMGNVIALKKGKSDQKVMIGAHMDEIGFIVKHIDEDGFIHFHTLGGFDPKTHTAQRVIIHGKKPVMGVMGTKPIHLMTAEERKKAMESRDYFIDTGLSRKELIKNVKVGDPITRERTMIEMGDCVNCKSIDNRVSVFILIETLKALKKKKPAVDVYAVFTVQEEVGIRGASVAAHTINPDFGIGLDTTIAFDLPGSKPEEVITKLGHGVAIKVMDSMTICDPRMVDFMKNTADKNKIPWQTEVLPLGGTDTAGIQRMGKNGSISGAISIPTRHLHQVIEMAHKKDIEGAIKLLTNCLATIDQHNWKH